MPFCTGEITIMDQQRADRADIRELIENWAVWRDSGQWDRLRTVWHDDGRMEVTWFKGTADEFIVVARDVWDLGVNVIHFLGGTSIDLNGMRAVAQTKVMINNRVMLEGAPCNIVTFGRFYDFFEKRQGAWGLVLRQCIYEKDDIDPIDPANSPRLDAGLLGRFPEGYRYLAYWLERLGYPVFTDLPGQRGPAVEALYARGASWLTKAGCPAL